jgi:hypothetical protein
LGLPYPDPNNQQWIIGYQYFGGFSQWTPNASLTQIPGTHSPVKLGQSKPYWCLAADLIAKINGVWGSPDTQLPPVAQQSCKFIPQHRSGHPYPAGGNEVFADGSVQWCKVQTMFQFTTWTSTGRNFWFYQDLSDISTPSVLSYINGLKWNPAVDQ